MVDWQAEACRAIGLAVAPSSQKCYTRAVSQFEAFRTELVAHPGGALASLQGIFEKKRLG